MVLDRCISKNIIYILKTPCNFYIPFFRKGSGRKADNRKGFLSIQIGTPKIRVSSSGSQESVEEDMTDTSSSASDEEDEGIGGLHVHDGGE